MKRGLELAQKSSDPRQDLINCMLSTRDENKREVITEKGIEDNAILNGIHDVFFYSATDNLYRKSEQHKQQQYAKQF